MTALDYAQYRTWKGWDDASFGQCAADAAIYYSQELRRSGIGSLQDRRVLEVGFGNGQFAGWCRGTGADYIGIEAIAELVAKARQVGLNAHDASEPWGSYLADGSLDLVVAFDVFEHLRADALLGVLRSMRKALRPSGRLIARVPSADSPFSRAIQHGDMTHQCAIGSSMVRQLAAQAGFNVDGLREPTFPLRGMGVMKWLRRASVVACRRLAYPLIAQAFMGGGRPVLTPNLVFVLVKP